MTLNLDEVINELEKSKKDLIKSSSLLSKTYELYDIPECVQHSIIENAKDEVNGQSNEDKMELLHRYSSCHIYRFCALSRRTLESLKDNIPAFIIDEVGTTLLRLSIRKYACEKIIDLLSDVTEDEINLSAAKASIKRAVKIIDGKWNWRCTIDYLEGEYGGVEIKEEELYSVKVRGVLNFNYSLNYLNDVVANDLSVVLLNGDKAAVTLAAEPLEVADGELFKLKVFYSKVPRDVTTWSLSPGDFKKICHVEEIYYARNGEHFASGNTAARALSTLGRRMRKDMFDIMGI